MAELPRRFPTPASQAARAAGELHLREPLDLGSWDAAKAEIEQSPESGPACA